MIISPILQKDPFRGMLYAVGQTRATGVVERVLPYLQGKVSLLDIGAGPCTIAEQLLWRGFQVTALDIDDMSLVTSISPKLYDGKRLPFSNNSFDAALFLSVLHHTPHPANLIQEAMRVAPRLIILEDVYTNTPHRLATYAADSLLNFEFWNHPRSNLQDHEWRSLFQDLGLRVVSANCQRSLGVFQHALYCVERG